MLKLNFKDIYKNVESTKKKSAELGDKALDFTATLIGIVISLVQIAFSLAFIAIVLRFILRDAFFPVFSVIVGIAIVYIIIKIGRVLYNKKVSEMQAEEYERILNEKINIHIKDLQPTDFTHEDFGTDVFLSQIELEETKKSIPLSKQEKHYQEAIGKVENVVHSLDTLKKVDDEFYNVNTYGITDKLLSFLEEKHNLSFDKENLFSTSRIEHLLRRESQSLQRELEYQLNGLKTGNEGERKMRYALNLLKQQEDLIVIEGLYLKHQNKTFETDFLVLSKRGIFSLEVKNYGSEGQYELKVTTDGQWLKVYPDGHVEPMKDVTSQANYHVSLTEGLLKQNLSAIGIDKAPVIHSHIVLGNDKVILDNQANVPITRVSLFASEMTKQPEGYSMEEMLKIANWLKANQFAEKEIEVYDKTEHLLEIHKKFLTIHKQYSILLNLESEVEKELIDMGLKQS